VPVSSGGHQRAFNLVKSLTELGDVDVFFTQPVPGDEVAEFGRMLDGLRVHAPAAGTVPVWRGHVRWLRTSGLPSGLGFTDRARLRSAFTQWGAARYDLALFVRIDTWYGLHGVVAGPHIVDLDDLMDTWTARRLVIRRSGQGDPPGSAWGGLRSRLRDFRYRSDVSRWARLQDRVAEQADAVLTCSELDARRLGRSNVAVVPNGYELRGEPVGRVYVGPQPTFVFPGVMTYAPNIDAAQYFVRETLPLLREMLPAARVVIAGDASDDVLELADPPAVTVAGWVERMEDVLAVADAVIVPLRIGGGTRIKIVEAWAHGIPVVSTTIGAEGLECESGRELLIADAPGDFARACYDVVTQPGLRQRLVAAGRDRSSELTWEQARRRFAEVTAQVLQRTRDSSSADEPTIGR
jgi:glycosyltransferase involved in cell wall biosynthesis